MKRIFIILIATTCSLVADTRPKNSAMIAGAIVQNGTYEFKDRETMSSFLSRYGGLACSDEMRKDYNNGKVVGGIRIQLHRNNEVINVAIKNGNSFFNTITLMQDDILFVKYENMMTAKFYYFNNIFGMPSHKLQSPPAMR